MKPSNLYFVTISTILFISIILGGNITYLQKHHSQKFEFLTRRLRGYEIAGPDKVDTGVAVPEKVDIGVAVPDKVDTGVAGPDKVDTGVAVPDKIDTGVAVPDKVDTGVAVPEKVDTGVAVPDKIDTGATGPDKVDIGVSGPDKVDTGVPVPNKVDTGVSGPDKVDNGVAGEGPGGEATVVAPVLKVVAEKTLVDQANRREVYKEATEVKDDDAGSGVPFAVGRTDESCDVFNGRWVRDEVSRPHYTEEACPFISTQMTCLAHGRPEKAYQFWRWQPHGCSLPSFNATLMLEKLRGKRMLFVGDSLGASQYFSMACLVHKVTPLTKGVRRGSAMQALRSKEYNVNIEFYWAPFLVPSNCDDSGKHKVVEEDREIHLYSGAIDKHADHWKGADVLIYNTYTWWNTKTLKIKTLTSKANMTQIEVMDTTKAYRMVMKKLVNWVERNMDPRKTRVFFTTMSPTHWKSQDWGGKKNMNCYGETSPIEDQKYWGSGASKSIMEVVSEAVGSSRVPIAVNNITQLSEYRKDAHTTIYKVYATNVTLEERKKKPRMYADCVHWCIPGVQDTWNELQYAKLFFP